MNNRSCPACGKLAVSVSELETNDFTHCQACHQQIEKWFSFSIFISIVFGGGAFLCFKSDNLLLGLPLFIMSVLYSTFYRKINSRYMPLKAYPKH
jgi:hypothetical protein